MTRSAALRKSHAEATSNRSEAGVEEWKLLTPIPADAPRDYPPRVRGKPSSCWVYRDNYGRRLFLVCRFDRPHGRKEFAPLTFCQGPDGRRAWRWKAPPNPRPLYGLDRLAARPEARVLVVEGEKSADAAQKLFPDYVAITSPNGAEAAASSDWSPLAGRDVTIWPDADQPGKGYADDVAGLATRAGAASVRIVMVPDYFPDKWDLADKLPDGVNKGDIERMLAAAEPAVHDGPLPLFPPLGMPAPYPVEALGPVLSPAAAAISRKVQVPPAMAAQSVLAAASLVAQAYADVMLPFGQTRPLSLYFVTVAASGDRKTTADGEALWPIKKREKALREARMKAHQTWLVERAAWEAEKRKITRRR